MAKQSDPIISGPNRGLCGPIYSNAVCSAKAEDWTDGNGPCCAVNGTCGEAIAHCNYPGIDFREILQHDYWIFQDMVYRFFVKSLNKALLKDSFIFKEK